jgi:LPXTG-site transpeptidase (sortase) family protein
MYRQHNSFGGGKKFLAGIVIVIGAVLTFVVYQGRQTLTNIQLPALTSTVQADGQQVQLTPTVISQQPRVQSRVLAGNVDISAPIIPVYYGRTENWDISRLGAYAGHLQGTSDYGMRGNYVLIGHIELKDGSKGAFAQLDKLKINDVITLMIATGDKTQFVPYLVTESKVVDTDDISVIRNHGYEELTLLTCHDYSFQDGVYKTRYVVHAIPLKDKADNAKAVIPKK